MTGAAGFIGARVAGALAVDGHDVVGIDVMLPAAHGPGSQPPPGCHRVDVRDADALAPLLDGVDVVCHQAAMVGAGVNVADAPAYGSLNDYATTVLLAQMYAAGLPAFGAGVVDGGVRAGPLRLSRSRISGSAAAPS